MIDWRVVPLKKWPGELTKERKQHRFSTGKVRRYEVGGEQRSYQYRERSVDWDGTTSLLERELEHLEATGVVLQMNVSERDIRNDGWIRANARPAHPGVILSFNARRIGPLSYPCDTYDDWQANVRAIALSLEALRAVDRHGVTKRGEQYSGFAQLPPGGGSSTTMTAQVAADTLADAADNDFDVADLLTDAAAVKYAYRYAAKRAHPDAGGSVEWFQRVQLAKTVLDRHHGGEG